MGKQFNYLKKYLSDLTSVIGNLDLDKLEMIYREMDRVRKEQGYIYVFGNGGSAATVGHLICDIGKNT